MTTQTTLPDLSFNPAAAISVERIGQERQPLLRIDDVLLHPEQMVEYAVSSTAFATPNEGSYYPGINAALPPDYGSALVTALRPLLAQVFGLPANRAMTYDGFFALTTRLPEALEPIQRIPHFDSANPYRIAMVHYFCGPPYGGTAFFRHQASGYESIDSNRVDAYHSVVMRELEEGDGPPLTFADAATPHYEQTHAVEAVFNRLIVYRSSVLHSGVLDPALLDADPRRGRLTANSFIEIHRGSEKAT